jgi:hypothetical protein
MEQIIDGKIATMLNDKKMLIGLFENNSNADKAFLYLISNGYTSKEISIAMSESTRATFYKENVEATEVVSSSMEGATLGTAVGSTIVLQLALSLG